MRVRVRAPKLCRLRELRPLMPRLSFFEASCYDIKVNTLEKPLVSDDEFRQLAEFRYQIRLYLSFSRDKNRKLGINPQQYQMLLAVCGLPLGRKPTITAIAERLQIRHNSAVELADRCIKAGLLVKWHDMDDRRQMILRVTEKGSRMLTQLVSMHREELRVRAPHLLKVLESSLAQSPVPEMTGVAMASAQPPAERQHQQ